MSSFTAVTGATYTAAQYNTHVRDVLDALAARFAATLYVGIVIETVVPTNPGTLLGFGTWVAFGTGRVTVGIDAAQTEFDTVEETGGAKTHTLTTPEIPAHTHSTGLYDATNAGGSTGNRAAFGGAVATGSAGGGGAHNNLQPYVVVYRWKRTA